MRGAKGGSPGVNDVAHTNLQEAIKSDRDVNTDD